MEMNNYLLRGACEENEMLVIGFVGNMFEKKDDTFRMEVTDTRELFEIRFFSQNELLNEIKSVDQEMFAKVGTNIPALRKNGVITNALETILDTYSILCGLEKSKELEELNDGKEMLYHDLNQHEDSEARKKLVALCIENNFAMEEEISELGTPISFKITSNEDGETIYSHEEDFDLHMDIAWSKYSELKYWVADVYEYVYTSVEERLKQLSSINNIMTELQNLGDSLEVELNDEEQ